MRTKPVSETILAQLGGNKFLVMTGARSLTTDGNNLRMKLPRNASKVNMVNVTLEANDTYTVTFLKYRGLTLEVLAEVDTVYGDQLRAIFESHTGLKVSL